MELRENLAEAWVPWPSCLRALLIPLSWKLMTTGEAKGESRLPDLGTQADLQLLRVKGLSHLGLSQESGCPGSACKLLHSKSFACLVSRCSRTTARGCGVPGTQGRYHPGFQKEYGQRDSHRKPCVTRDQRNWGSRGVLPAQEGHGKDKWEWLMGLWREVCGRGNEKRVEHTPLGP